MNNQLKKVFDYEAKALQQSVHDAFRDGAGGGKLSSADAPEVGNKSLSLIAGHPKRAESAISGFSFAHSANREQRQSQARAASDSGARLCTIHL